MATRPSTVGHMTRRALLAAPALAVLVGYSPPAAAAQNPPVQWDLRDLFADGAHWDAERWAIEAAVPDLAPSSLETGSALQAVLDRRAAISLRTWRLVLYAVLKSDEDVRVTANAARRGEAFALQARIDTANAWIPGAVISLGAARVSQMLRETAGLQVYRYPLETMRRRAPHTLDAKGEALLASSVPLLAGAQTIRQTLISSDIVFPTVEIGGTALRIDLQGYERVMTSAPRQDRARAYDAYAKTVRGYERTFGNVLGAKVAGNVFVAASRNYPSALDASLDASAIPRGVYETLLAEVKGQLPLHHRYLEVKRRLLGVERLAIWDVPTPAVALDRRWTLAEARATTLQAVSPLGAAYGKQFAANTLKPWSDAAPRDGKREGGYVAGHAYAHPYVLLNHAGDFASLSTYAHEWGHAMHSWYAHTQPYPLYDFPTFVAEIPSKANELLLLDDLISAARTKAERVFYLDRLCEQYRGTLFVQSMFAEFELAVHTAAEAGAPMTGPTMSAAYRGLMQTYFGPGVELHPDSGALWATVLHFYLNFYVFQYATCLVAATAFVDAIRREGEPARRRYLGLLAAGGSDDAYRLIRTAGVDLARPEPYRRALARFSRAIDDLEQAAA